MLGKPTTLQTRTIVATPPPPQTLQKGSRRYARMNSLTGRLLVLLVVLSVIPVASNRPAWWLFATLLIAAGALLYLLRAQYLMGARRQLQINHLRLFFGLAVVVPVYAFVQALPLAAILPSSWVAVPLAVPSELWPDSISVVPDASVLGAIRALGFLIFLMLVIEVGTQPVRSRGLVLLLVLGIAAHAVYGLLALRVLDDFALWGEKTAYRGVLTGTFVNRNSFATFLGFGMVLTLALALERGNRVANSQRDGGFTMLLTPQRLEVAGLWALFALFALAIPLTESRMGVAASAVGSFVTFVVLRIRFGTSLLRIGLEATLALAMFAFVLLSNMGSGVAERSIFAFLDIDNRTAIYQITLQMIQDRPLTGFGYDSFAAAFQLYRADPLISANYYDLAHNTYLALWSEQGFLIGSIPMLLGLWAVALILKRLYRGEGDFAVLGGALGVLALAAVHSVADFSLEIPANVYCYLLVVGLAIAPSRDQGKPAANGAGRP